MSTELIIYSFLKFLFIYFIKILAGLTCLDTEGTESVACYISEQDMSTYYCRWLTRTTLTLAVVALRKVGLLDVSDQ